MQMGREIPVVVDQWVAELVPRFLANRRRDVTAALDAVERQDWPTILTLAHNIRGISGGYGFVGLSAIGAELEAAARGADAAAVRAATGEILAYVDAVRLIVRP